MADARARLTALIYLLIRDEVPFGHLLTIVHDIEKAEDQTIAFTNLGGQLVAENVADRILGREPTLDDKIAAQMAATKMEGYEAAAADRDRLDFVEMNKLKISCSTLSRIAHPNVWRVISADNKESSAGRTLREAIDEALMEGTD